MRRILLWVLGVVVAVTVAGAIWFRMAPDDPAIWHVDPVTAQRADSPNQYIVAPEGLRPDADRTAKVHSGTARDLLFQFDSVAGASSTRLAGSLEDGHITYVQRTAIMGYPDYISVKAVEVEGGAALAIYSRSRFGKSDFGVNQDRIDRWLAQIGE